MTTLASSGVVGAVVCRGRCVVHAERDRVDDRPVHRVVGVALPTVDEVQDDVVREEIGVRREVDPGTALELPHARRHDAGRVVQAHVDLGRCPRREVHREAHETGREGCTGRWRRDGRHRRDRDRLERVVAGGARVRRRDRDGATTLRGERGDVRLGGVRDAVAVAVDAVGLDHTVTIVERRGHGEGHRGKCRDAGAAAVAAAGRVADGAHAECGSGRKVGHGEGERRVARGGVRSVRDHGDGTGPRDRDRGQAVAEEPDVEGRSGWAGRRRGGRADDVDDDAQRADAAGGRLQCRGQRVLPDEVECGDVVGPTQRAVGGSHIDPTCRHRRTVAGVTGGADRRDEGSRAQCAVGRSPHARGGTRDGRRCHDVDDLRDVDRAVAVGGRDRERVVADEVRVGRVGEKGPASSHDTVRRGAVAHGDRVEVRVDAR